MIVDFQHHYTPREIAEAKGEGGRLGASFDADGNPSYLFNPLLSDLDAHIRMMNRAGIDIAVLSCADGMDNPDRASCAFINDKMKQAEEDYPGRFAIMGSVPLGDPHGGQLVFPAAAGLWAPALLLPPYSLADATWTLVRRALRREKLWRAHREHFYQRAVQRGFSHGAVTGRIMLCNLVLVLLALVAVSLPGLPARLFCLLSALLAVAVLLFILARQRAPVRRPESAPPPNQA